MSSPPDDLNGVPDGGVRAALRSRSFSTLLAGYAVSAIGDGMTVVALAWLAIVLAHGHGTGVLVGAAIAAYTLPGMVAGMGLGRILSRWDPRSLVLADALLRAGSLGLVAVGAVLGILTPLEYVGLLAVSSLLGLLGVTGALTSVVELLPESQHVAGNSLITVASFAAYIAGPALAGLVIALAGPGPAIGADAASYAVLAGAVVLSRRIQRPPAPTSEAQSMVRALGALRRQPSVLGITVLCVVFFGLYGPVEVALPVFVSQTLHAGPGVLGGYWTLFAIGATAGGLGASYVQRFGLWRVAVAVMAAWGACLVPFGFVDSVFVGFAALAVGGLVYGPFLPLKKTIIQRHSPPGSLTALAAASAILTLPASPIGTALGGPLVATIGPAPTLLASGLATIAAAAVAAVILVIHQGKRSRQLGATPTVPG
ncbi:MAG TPA: MFS transporter [Candidatus Dormibacteraeota bacterium]|nr:MFS transporter [Candidatus Dormibacteraeota bacterium]